jgi:hypothetical protein
MLRTLAASNRFCLLVRRADAVVSALPGELGQYVLGTATHDGVWILQESRHMRDRVWSEAQDLCFGCRIRFISRVHFSDDTQALSQFLIHERGTSVRFGVGP